MNIYRFEDGYLRYSDFEPKAQHLAAAKECIENCDFASLTGMELEGFKLLGIRMVAPEIVFRDFENEIQSGKESVYRIDYELFFMPDDQGFSEHWTESVILLESVLFSGIMSEGPHMLTLDGETNAPDLKSA